MKQISVYTSKWSGQQCNDAILVMPTGLDIR